MITLINKDYEGFESLIDIGDDIYTMFEGKGIVGEFSGTLSVVITYKENA